MSYYLIKILFCLALIVAFMFVSSMYFQENKYIETEVALKQLNEHESVNAQKELDRNHFMTNNGLMVGWGIVALVCIMVFLGDLQMLFKKMSTTAIIGMVLLISGSGCGRPFQPVKLEVIKSNEEAFLLPLTTEGNKQTSSDNEAYLRSNLVYSKQVQIPQQWVPKGYETTHYNGEWRDSALLIKVDKSPVTREWTADPTTGTSNKNEAIWVMTSDQVEFSTGWTITARIANRDDAVKFLHNYPNGSLTSVLDTEVRSKIQAEFGLEVTDLPMDELRKNATPHILKVVESITKFFKDRGIMITNLGITGGFIYKDRSILDTMVKVFNAEQEASIAVAATNAQRKRNEAVILEAEGRSSAILKVKKAEADGIKMIADAKLYELEKTTANFDAYVKLKQIELQKDLLGKWDGQYPRYFMGTGGSNNPNMLLQLPTIETAPPAKKKD